MNYPTSELIERYFNTNLQEKILPLGSQWHIGQFTSESLFSVSYLNSLIGTSMPNPITGFNNQIIGIDIPVLLNKTDLSNNENEKEIKDLVIILGQDPLRSSNDSAIHSIGADISKDVIIGTPYAVHMPKSYKGVRLYHEIFLHILKGNHCVYCTDILKFHTNHKNPTNNKNVNDFNKYWNNKAISQKAINLLIDEFTELMEQGYNLKYIILWGEQAQKTFSLVKNNFPSVTPICMIHPAARSTKSTKSGWYKYINTATIDCKIDFIINELKKYGI